MTIADKTFTAPWDIFPQAATGQELGHAANLWDLFTREVTFNAASGANVITVPDNVANAVNLVDAGGIEYMRVDTQNAQPQVHWNQAGADIDYRWEAVGVDPALFIQGSDGYVGIGTAAPTEVLYVIGNAAIANISTLDNKAVGPHQSLRYIHIAESTSGNTTLANAEVVIGHATDTNTLGDILGQVSFWSSDASSNATGRQAIIKALSESTSGRAAGFGFFTGVNVIAVVERVRISSGGYMGIGTTSPDRLLHAEIADAVTNAVTYAQRLSHITSGAAAAGFATGIEFELEDDGGGFDVLGSIQTIETDATAGAEHGGFAIFTADIGDDGLAERVRVDHDGRVGVMIAAPAAQLHVDQSVVDAAIPVLYLDQADVDQEMIEFATTIGVGNAIEAVGGKTLTVTHFIKCTIPGPLTRYIPCGTIA